MPGLGKQKPTGGEAERSERMEGRAGAASNESPKPRKDSRNKNEREQESEQNSVESESEQNSVGEPASVEQLPVADVRASILPPEYLPSEPRPPKTASPTKRLDWSRERVRLAEDYVSLMHAQIRKLNLQTQNQQSPRKVGRKIADEMETLKEDGFKKGGKADMTVDPWKTCFSLACKETF